MSMNVHRLSEDQISDTIKCWNWSDHNGWIGFIRSVWKHDFGSIREEDGTLTLATGGWSENEQIIQAMMQNTMLWAILWESSHRGGLYVLRMPTTL